jgi:hypothetical protein
MYVGKSELGVLQNQILQDAKSTGYFDKQMAEAQKPIGINVETRWQTTHKNYKPLRDLIGEVGSKVHEILHRDLTAPGVEQFVMSPEMAYQVQQLATNMHNKPEELAMLMPKVMPPYSKVCVEMPITSEVSKLRFPVTKEDLEERGIMQVQRIGALIESYEIGEEDDKSLAFNFMPYYEFVGGNVASPGVGLLYVRNETIPGGMPINLRGYGWTWNGMYSRQVVEVCKAKGIDPTANLTRTQIAGLQILLLEAADELPSLFFMWMVLLNSKSGITKTKVAPRFAHPGLGKRERSRRSRSGFTVVSLTDVENVTPEGLVEPKHTVNAHWVRGHFKARRSGIYWWRPFVRGTGDVQERDSYKLNP